VRVCACVSNNHSKKLVKNYCNEYFNAVSFSGVDICDFYDCFHLPICVSISALLNIWKDSLYFMIGQNITLHEAVNKADFLVSKCLVCT